MTQPKITKDDLLPDLPGYGRSAWPVRPSSLTDLADHPFNWEPTVFSGPFMLTEWVKDDHVTLVRNPDFWKGAPYLDGIVWKVVANATVEKEMLKAGETDIAGIEAKYLTEMEEVEALDIYKFFRTAYTYIGLQQGDPPLLSTSSDDLHDLGALRRYEWMGAWARFGGDHLAGLLPPSLAVVPEPGLLHQLVAAVPVVRVVGDAQAQQGAALGALAQLQQPGPFRVGRGDGPHHPLDHPLVDLFHL